MIASGERGPRSPIALAVVMLLGLATIIGFSALGTWQVHRRAWKLALITAVDQRVQAAPIPAPGPADWPRLDPDHDAYRRVRVSGRYRIDCDTLVQAVTDLGAGYWVLTPLVSDRGFTLLINRGFVPPGWHEPRAQQTRVSLTGLLRFSEPGGAFLRHNDPHANRWYSRDVAAISAARNLGIIAPFFIDAAASSSASGQPVGGLTVIQFANNHLVYAITWYGLGLMTAWRLFLLIRGERQRRPPGS